MSERGDHVSRRRQVRKQRVFLKDHANRAAVRRREDVRAVVSLHVSAPERTDACSGR